MPRGELASVAQNYFTKASSFCVIYPYFAR